MHHYCSDINLSHVTLTYESHSSIYFLQISALFHPNEASYWRSSDAIRCYKWKTLLLHYVRTKQFKGHGSYFYSLLLFRRVAWSWKCFSQTGGLPSDHFVHTHIRLLLHLACLPCSVVVSSDLTSCLINQLKPSETCVLHSRRAACVAAVPGAELSFELIHICTCT